MPRSRPCPGVRRSCPLLVLCSLITLFCVGCGGGESQQEHTPPPAPVVTAVIEAGEAPHVLHAVGEVRPSETVKLRSRVDGMIVKTHFLDGQEVKAGDLLFTIDPEVLALEHTGEEARVSELRVKAENAQTEFERYRTLYAKGVVSREELDTKATAARSAQEALRQDHARAQVAQRKLEYATLTAPISGRAGATDLREGTVVTAYQDELVTIKTIAPAEVAFALPQKHLHQVRRHMAQGALEVRATPAGLEEPELGTLFFLDNWVDPDTGMITLKARFANQAEHLWPGQFAKVDLVLFVQHDAVLAPITALQHGPEGPFVYVVQDGKAQVRPVRFSVPVEERIVIDEGLEPGEVVVTDGQLRLFPGAAVREYKPEAQSGSPAGQPAAQGGGAS